jgi:hypothetical protein
MANCKICNMQLDEDIDCGGDCVFCMADAGDPECVKSVIAIARTTHAVIRALEGVLGSAVPNRNEHQGMYKAWKTARAVVIQAKEQLKK